MAYQFMPKDGATLAELKRRAQKLSYVHVQQDEDRQKAPFILFCLGDKEQYGISYECISEVIKKNVITFVPHAPDYIVGVINKRGIILPVIDLKIIFGINASSKLAHQSIIVVGIGKTTVGLLIDEIIGNVNLVQNDLKPSIIGSRNTDQYVIGIHNSITAILDVSKILSNLKLDIKKIDLLGGLL